MAEPSASVSRLLFDEESSRDLESEYVLPVLLEDLEVLRADGISRDSSDRVDSELPKLSEM